MTPVHAQGVRKGSHRLRRHGPMRPSFTRHAASHITRNLFTPVRTAQPCNGIRHEGKRTPRTARARIRTPRGLRRRALRQTAKRFHASATAPHARSQSEPAYPPARLHSGHQLNAHAPIGRLEHSLPQRPPKAGHRPPTEALRRSRRPFSTRRHFVPKRVENFTRRHR